MAPDEIRQKIDLLDTASWGEEEIAWAALRPLGEELAPYLHEAYGRFRKWQGRTSLVYHSVQFARASEDAFALGVTALADRSYMVRYRACALLAYSLRHNALPLLEARLDDPHPLVARSALAACNAIRAQDQNLFADWSLSGQTRWVVRREEQNSDLRSYDRQSRSHRGLQVVPPLPITT